MMNKTVSRSLLQAGLTVRSGLKAGRTMCYQEINGVWYPMTDPIYPTPYPPAPTPSTPSVQWLSCQSCQGTRTSDRALRNATCEVCRMS